MADTNPEGSNHEEHFYKGLFFGLLVGVGLVWLLNSEGGKELIKTARKKIDKTLAAEPGMADYEFEDEEVGPVEEQAKMKPSSNPRRFFQKKSK